MNDGRSAPAVRADPAQRRERLDPDESERPLPWIVVMSISAMAMWSLFYIYDMNAGLDSRYGDSRTPAALMPAASAGAAGGAADGGAIYAAKCAACHQGTGTGIPGVFPPLAGSEWVLGSDRVLVQIPLHGVSGTLMVNGVAYRGAMPAFGSLSDEEIAAVLSHVRGQWGNHAPAVSAATVAAGRAASKARTTPWTDGDEIRRAAAP
jgi:mono/diheme cytochrome c family protein